MRVLLFAQAERRGAPVLRQHAQERPQAVRLGELVPWRQSQPPHAPARALRQKAEQPQRAMLGRRIEPGQCKGCTQQQRQQPEPQADVAELAPAERGDRRAEQESAGQHDVERAHRDRPDRLPLAEVRRHQVRRVGCLGEAVHGSEVKVRGDERRRDTSAADDGAPADDAKQPVFQVGHGPTIKDAEHQPEAEYHKAKRGHSEACQRELIR